MFTTTEIAAASGGWVIGPESNMVTGVSTDSRSVQPGELFVPLRGANFDGHDFIAEVIDKGIRTILAEEAWLENNTLSPLTVEGRGGGDVAIANTDANFTHPLAPLGSQLGSYRQERGNITIIAVKNTLTALGDLAAAWRRRFSIPVVGITGSNGKTTTKEMLATIQNQTGPGLKTGGNLNNLIGLPQMLFQMKPEHHWAVLEMGMSEPGEINRLAEIAAPQVGIVLNAFPAHLESMGSVENVARAKGELLLRLPSGGTAIVNADDALIAAHPTPSGVRRITFGLAEADVRALDIIQLGIDGQLFTLKLHNTAQTIHLHAFGIHNIYNALAAAAAADALGISTNLIRAGLEAFRPYDKRFQLEQTGGLVLIDDSYNANPASMGAALATLADLKGDKRTFVAIGSMLELGGNEAELHRQLGMQAARVADRLYLYGELTAHTYEGALSAGMPGTAIMRADSHDMIVIDIMARAAEGDFVLVKGSRGMRMERVAEGIRNKS